MKKRVLPNFFIVGAAKAGTTSFAEYLAQHPEVYMSPVKEPHYFCSDIDSSHLPRKVQPEQYFASPPLRKLHTMCVRRPEHYEQLFHEAGDAKAVGEASVSYLYSELAPRRISEEIADPRILIFLRNPIERAYSHFQMDVEFGLAGTSDFLKAVERDISASKKGWGLSHLYVELGLYVPQLRRYLQQFPADRVKVYFHDDYRADVSSTLLDIQSFLGVRHSLDDISVGTRHGTGGPRPVLPVLQQRARESRAYRLVQKAIPQDLRSKMKRLLSRQARRMRRREFEALIPYFREDVLELSDMMRRDLTHWLRARAGM